MDGFTVLFVEDNADYSTCLEKALSQYGLTIRRVGDNDSALAEIQKRGIDVVLADVTVPEIDGIDLLKRIKAMDPLVEVILLAGQADLSIAILGMELGAFDFLFKSIAVDELVYKLRDAAEKKSIQEAKIVKIRHAMEKND
jgi:DNA-binding NtrC family response regulator